MNPNPEAGSVAPPPPSQPKTGLAIASLVLGVLACISSVLVIGLFLGLIGGTLGMVHICKKRGPKLMAGWGIGLSILGVLLSVALAVVYYQFFSHTMRNGSSNAGALAKWEGKPAPDISIKLVDGKAVRLSELRGKKVVLDFWATWCGPCSQEIPHFTRLYSDSSRKDLEIIGISSEEADKVREFAARKGMNYPVASLDDLPAPYNEVQFIPTTFFIDRKGLINSIAVGYRDFNELKSLAASLDNSKTPEESPGGSQPIRR